jgi:hypothetical protein
MAYALIVYCIPLVDLWDSVEMVKVEGTQICNNIIRIKI